MTARREASTPPRLPGYEYLRVLELDPKNLDYRTTYGILLGQWPLIVTNAICLALSSFILAMKLLPGRKRDAVADAVAAAVPVAES